MKRTRPHAEGVTSSVDRSAALVLKSLMAQRGHRLEDVVEGTGISRATVQRRRQAGGFTLEEVAALAAFYDVPLTWFVDPPEGLRFHPDSGSSSSYTLTPALAA